MRTFPETFLATKSMLLIEMSIDAIRFRTHSISWVNFVFADVHLEASVRDTGDLGTHSRTA